MTLRVTITLAGAAQGKARHRTRVQATKDGRTFAQEYPDGRSVKYESQLRYAAQCEMNGRPPTIQPCRVIVDVYMQAPSSGSKREIAARLRNDLRPLKKPDVDNFLKSVGDALNGVVWKDDSAIVEATVRKWWADDPRLVIEVETIEPPALPAPPREAGRGVWDLFAPMERVGDVRPR
jgi:Holliday junction resolvase RusA-like endonuclease